MMLSALDPAFGLASPSVPPTCHPFAQHPHLVPRCQTLAHPPRLPYLPLFWQADETVLALEPLLLEPLKLLMELEPLALEPLLLMSLELLLPLALSALEPLLLALRHSFEYLPYLLAF